MDFSFGSEVKIRERLFLRVGRNYMNNLTWYVHLVFILFLVAYLFKDKFIYSGNINFVINENYFMRYVIGFVLFVLIMWIIT